MNLRTLLLYNKQICTILVTTRCLVESGSASFTNSHQNRFCRGNDPRAQCCDVCQVLKSICAWRFRLGNLSCCALGWENQKVLLILLFYIFPFSTTWLQGVLTNVKMKWIRKSIRSKNTQIPETHHLFYTHLLYCIENPLPNLVFPVKKMTGILNCL